VAFARMGDPNTSDVPRWPAYSTGSRDTMLFNDTLRVEQDPDRGPRRVMEQVLKLSKLAGADVPGSVTQRRGHLTRNVRRPRGEPVHLLAPRSAPR